MNQSVFIIRHDFFDNPIEGQAFIKKLVEENCTSEKLALVYDPIAEDFFIHVAKTDHDLFEQLISDFYSYWENSKDALQLKWYQLDESCTFHFTFLNPVLYALDPRFSSYLIGCLPLFNYDPNMYLFFMISTSDLEDVFLLIDSNHYSKVLDNFIQKFNDFVKENNKGENIMIKNK